MSWFNPFSKKEPVPVHVPTQYKSVLVDDYPKSKFSAYWEIVDDEVRFMHRDGRLLESHSAIGDSAKNQLIREKMESYRKE